MDDAAPDSFDFGTDADPDGAVVARVFAELDRLVLDAERATVRRKDLEQQLDRAKKHEEMLLQREIPDLLLKMRLEKCTTSSGVDVSVKRDIKASLPGLERVEARTGALRWLAEHGHGDVIKNVVRVDLARGEDTRADELIANLRMLGFEPVALKDVHAGTLGALVRELMGEGKIVPKDLFNLFDQRIAKLARKV